VESQRACGGGGLKASLPPWRPRWRRQLGSERSSAEKGHKAAIHASRALSPLDSGYPPLAALS
ncbi:MAG: hypothetical protein ACP5JG_18210, partial [Anaerolineae bacterium]